MSSLMSSLMAVSVPGGGVSHGSDSAYVGAKLRSERHPDDDGTAGEGGGGFNYWVAIDVLDIYVVDVVFLVGVVVFVR